MTDLTAESFDVVVIGGGPAGATAATDLALQGRRVLLIDRGDRIKPCGGAIPPRLIRDFGIPDEVLCTRIGAARAVAPSGRSVVMAVQDSAPGAYVGMVDRAFFDPWLRGRAQQAGALVRTGRFTGFERLANSRLRVAYRSGRSGPDQQVDTALLIGADGARSEVARQALPREKSRYVFAYHEIVRSPEKGLGNFAADCCDVVYRGDVSPDFYGWVFPHGETTSIGAGSAHKGFGLRSSVARLRAESGLDRCETVRREGAPIPLRPLRRWDDGRGVLLVGDAAGVVAPASGEGIYYAMLCGRMGAHAAAAALTTGDMRELASARRAFMAEHGKVFRILGAMQAVWYRNDWLRERFVSLCRDRDVQRLTWIAYCEKQLVRAQHTAHARLLVKNAANVVAGWLGGGAFRRSEMLAKPAGEGERR